MSADQQTFLQFSKISHSFILLFNSLELRSLIGLFHLHKKKNNISSGALKVAIVVYVVHNKQKSKR